MAAIWAKGVLLGGAEAEDPRKVPHDDTCPLSKGGWMGHYVRLREGTKHTTRSDDSTDK